MTQSGGFRNMIKTITPNQLANKFKKYNKYWHNIVVYFGFDKKHFYEYSMYAISPRYSVGNFVLFFVYDDKVLQSNEFFGNDIVPFIENEINKFAKGRKIYIKTELYFDDEEKMEYQYSADDI